MTIGVESADRAMEPLPPPLQAESGSRATAPGDTGTAALQGNVGNQAVQMFAADHLESPELAGSEFHAAYHDQPPLQVGDKRTRAVAQLQTLLADRFGLRGVMRNTFKTGAADGAWGQETTNAVREFQQRFDVRPVGGWEAGRKTLGAMDRELLRNRPAPQAPAIALHPAVAIEAQPAQFRQQPMDLSVSGSGFEPGTPLFVRFEDEQPFHAACDSTGRFARRFPAGRRSRGNYRVFASGLSLEVSTTLQVVPAEDPPPNPAREERYAFFLREATRMLRDAQFGSWRGFDVLKDPEGHTVRIPNFEKDQFDHEFWRWTDDSVYQRVLEVKPDKTAAQAIDALFARLPLWRVDCDHTIQIANLYAIRKTEGAELFNHRQGVQMRLRDRESSGLITRKHYGRAGPGEKWRVVQEYVPDRKEKRNGTLVDSPFVFAPGHALERSTDELLAEATPGSRVRWTNLAAPTSSAFRHENALRLGPNLFVAAGFDDPLTGNEFTRDRLEIEMALTSADHPTREYIRRNIYIDEIEVFDR